MKYFSCFSGIGGFELGIIQAYEQMMCSADSQEKVQGTRDKDGQPLECPHIGTEGLSCVGFSEIDKYATQIYKSHFPNHPEYGDITKINAEELPDFDCLVGGFPCQAFSIAGKRKGFEDTRGTLFFELARILQAKKPGLFVFENVKGLLSHDNGKTFSTIIATIDELGYDCQWQVLNSKNHGVPQNRERVYIVGHLRGSSRPKVFPFGVGDEEHFGETDLEGCSSTLTGRSAGGQNRRGNYVIGTLRTHKDGEGFREMKEGICPTIPARAREDGSGQPVIRVPEATKQGYAVAGGGDSINLAQPNSKTRRGRVGKGFAQTLDTQMQQFTLRGSRIRRLTPVECERLQGFPDNWTSIVSDTQRYKCCGNAVTTNVVRDIFISILGTALAQPAEVQNSSQSENMRSAIVVSGSIPE